nr:GntR family transcriptional regulator [Ornithinimicrobium sp. F0845]
MSKSQRAHAWIRDRIQARDYAPGHRLVLSTIAEQLDMSVVPVREAIRQLEAEGLVTFERNVGARVFMVDVAQYGDTMQTLALLEAAATALSAPHLTEADLREARRVNGRMRDQLDRLVPHEFTALNHQLHATLARRCPNERLMELVEGEWARLDNLRDSTFTLVPERAVNSVAEHDQLIHLVETAADPAQIQSAALHHRANTLHAYLTRNEPDLEAELIPGLTPGTTPDLTPEDTAS